MKIVDQLSHQIVWRAVGVGGMLVAIPAGLTALNVAGKGALWENVHWTVATWVMVYLGGLGWSQAQGRVRWVRGLLTLGLISYALGQIIWDVQWGPEYRTFPSLSDLFYLGMFPFFVAALVISARGWLARGDETALYLDASMLFLAFTTTIAVLYVPRAHTLSEGQLAILIAYPSLFLATAGAGLVGALKAHARFSLASPYLLLMGLSVSGVCWISWNAHTLEGTIPPGSYVGYGFSLAHLLIGMGVAVWDVIPSDSQNAVLWSRRLIRVLPILAIPLAIEALVWSRTQIIFLSWWVSLGSVGVIILALLRQSLLFWERDRLYVRERAALRQVEHVLAARQQVEAVRQVLLEIMRGGVMATDLTEFLALVHRTIGRVIYAENFFVSLYDKTTALFEEAYSVDQYDQPAGPHDLGKSASAYVFRTGQPLLLSQAQFDELVAQGEVELVGTNSPSWLGVPLKTPTETIGVMVVQHYEAAEIYSEQDVEFFASIAGQIALMVERKRTETFLQQFRALMDETQDAIYLIDLDTSQYVDFNKTALEYLGYTRAELSQLGVVQIAQHITNLDDWRVRVAQMMQEHGLIFETVFQRKDGTTFPVEVSARAWHYGERNVIVAIARDITERKRVEDALRYSEDRYRSLVENLPIGVYRTTPGERGIFLMANPAFVTMFGYESEVQLKTAAVEDFYIHPAERKLFSETLIALGSVTGLELLLKKRDGTPVISSITARVVYTSEGKIAHFDCTVEDITKRKKAEEELKRRGDEFAALYEITHDLAIQWDLPRLLETVVAQATALLKTPGGGIYFYDQERGDLRVEVSKGAGFPSGVRLALGEGLAGRVAQSLEPLIVEDYQVWEGRAPYYEHIPLRAVMGVPMLFGGELIGVLVVEHLGESNIPFTTADARLLSLIAAQAASAVHNARLFEATRHRLAELEAVSRISTALRTAQNLEEMLPLLLDETLAVLDTTAGSIVLYDPAKGGLYPATGRGWFMEIDQSPLQPGEGVVGHVFNHGEVYRVQEFITDVLPRASSLSQIPAGWGGVCLPIRTAQEVVGTMFIAVLLPRELSDEEVRLLVTLSEIAGNAIHRTRLFEQTQNIVHRLAALHVIDLAITSSFDLRVSLNVLLEQVLSLLKADAAIIFRLNASLHTLEFVAGRGLFTVTATKTTLRLGEAYAGQVALERKSISIPDLAEASPLQNTAFATVEAIRAYHAVPLLAKGQVKGVLEVFHRQPFEPEREWLNFLQTLGGQAAIALDNAELFTGLQHSNMELTLAYEATIEGWSRALDLRDKETEGHTQRVTETTLRLAKAMGLTGDELVHIRRGALLHDIGKMGVPDNVLLKPGPLTEEERTIMRCHPEYAYEMLAPIEYLHPALDIPYCHHEKWNGTGYPRGLQAEQIPLAARIFMIVDVWDALRSNRPYREAWTEAQVRAYLREESGKHFDPNVVDMFLKMLEQDEGPV